MATTCYKCSSTTDSSCNDAYSGNVDHEVDCSLNSDKEGDGCSKSKSILIAVGVKVTTGITNPQIVLTVSIPNRQLTDTHRKRLALL